MMPPFLVASRSGVEVVRDERLLPPLVRRRFQERRAQPPLWWVRRTVVACLCVEYAVGVSGESLGQQWLQPSVMLQTLGMLACGIWAMAQMFGASKTNRESIKKHQTEIDEIKEKYATKESVEELKRDVRGISADMKHANEKLDQLIGRTQ